MQNGKGQKDGGTLYQSKNLSTATSILENLSLANLTHPPHHPIWLPWFEPCRPDRPGLERGLRTESSLFYYTTVGCRPAPAASTLGTLCQP